eukprot:TRINITY_DN5563_c0_g1_i2.p1 TRINITY_DN5563_c0_g1~~TRINITY_DN5563_c0_g1_i2.p1  ORF type:complete len:299 (-),score=65.94 TRINITY_DN5563_c0_g1_i2:85-981(-)
MASGILKVIFLLVWSGAYGHVQPTPKADSVASSDITWDTMRLYLMYAYAAFCLDELKNWECYWCTYVPGLPTVNVTLVFESDGEQGTAGYVGYSNTSIVVSFRGSRTISNWVHDFEFWRIPYPDEPGVWVHRGFWHAYTNVEAAVVAAVVDLRSQFPSKQIVVTGHSLGAALSTLCAVDLTRRQLGDVRLWNYGSPRLGNPAFAAYANKILLAPRRVVNEADIVPHLIPQDIGYHHIAREVWFPTNFTTFVVCDSTGEDPSCSDSLYLYDPDDHTIYLGYQVAGTCTKLAVPNAVTES